MGAPPSGSSRILFADDGGATVLDGAKLVELSPVSAEPLAARRLAADFVKALQTGVGAVLIGRLSAAASIGAIGDALEFAIDAPPLILAPDCGAAEFDGEAVAELKRRLIVRTAILVVERDATERLCGVEIRDRDEAKAAARLLSTLGCEAAILLDPSGIFVAGPDAVQAKPPREVTPWRIAATAAIGVARGENGYAAAVAACRDYRPFA